MEVQEAIKVVHGQPTLNGEGLHLDGLFGGGEPRCAYPRRADCAGHEDLGEIVPIGERAARSRSGRLLDRAETAARRRCVARFYRAM